jgi:broad specificity phosphatase PhoE
VPAQDIQNCAEPEGESFYAFRERVLRRLSRVFEEHSEQLCIVGHGGVIRLALIQLFGMPEEEAWTLTKDYGGIVEVQQIGATPLKPKASPSDREAFEPDACNPG